MLARKYRLKKPQDFQAVFAQAKAGSNDFLLLRFLANQLGHSRLAVVVSAKVSKKAAHRNLLRRRVGEIIKVLRPRLTNDYDIVLSLRASALGLSCGQLKEQIERLFKKENLCQ